MREELPGRPCSVAAALNLIGEKWALLAVREIAFGNKRFDAIARNTGAPRDRLAARLRALEAGGVVERRQYSEHPPRYEYELTEAGQELRAVLTALRGWGDKWTVDVAADGVRARVRARARPGGHLPPLRGRDGPEELGSGSSPPAGPARARPAAEAAAEALPAGRLRLAGGQGGPEPERAGRQLAVRPRLLQRGRPPGEVVEHDVGGGVVIGFPGWPSSSKASRTCGMTTLLRTGTDSVSTKTWARCSIARTPPVLAAGVADEGDRLVPEAERDPHACRSRSSARRGRCGCTRA